MVVWWATEVECAAALARLERENELTSRSSRDAFEQLGRLRAAWTEVEPGASVRRTARRLVRVHPLRAADSLQLAAALVGAEGDPASLDVVMLDHRLARAAELEGFTVLEPEAPAR